MFQHYLHFDNAETSDNHQHSGIFEKPAGISHQFGTGRKPVAKGNAPTDLPEI
jgi:hypothetical protein